MVLIVTYEEEKIPGKVRLFSLETKNYVHNFDICGTDVYNIACNPKIMIIVS